MANVYIPYGFIPMGKILRCYPYDMDASDATAIFIGDVVDAENDGHVSASAANVQDILGASADYKAASTEKTDLGVFDHVDQEFQCQDDGSGTPTEDYRFGNADHIAGAGSTVTLKSGHELALSTISDATFGFRILGIINRIDNTVADNADWRVMVNEHHMQKRDGIYT